MPDDKFRLIITVTKSDGAGRMLRRMANGQVVVWSTIEEAHEAMQGYLEIARVLMNGLHHPDRRFVAYGAIIVQDETTGAIRYAHSLNHGAAC